MVPNEQWDDFALTREFAALERRIDTYEDAIKGLAHFPIDVATAALNIEHLTTEIQSVRTDLGKVAAACEQMREDRVGEIEARRKGRTAIVVAIITGCFTVLAALVVLVGTLAGS